MRTGLNFIVQIIALLCYSCDENDVSWKQDCVRGRYIGPYCEGIVVEILDDHNIGQNWESIYGTETYSNSVVASIDTTLLQSHLNYPSYFTQDSTFFFRYTDGGYARKQYNVCEPSPFITITYISKNSCNYEAEK